MEQNSFELAESLRKVADLLMKEDYFNNLQETIKTKNIIIKELLKVIVMSYNNLRKNCGVNVTGTAEDVKAHIDSNILYFNDCLKIKGFEDVSNVVEELYRYFDGE